MTLIESSLNLANILKLNDEELPILAAAFKLSSDEAILSALYERFDLRVAVTQGADGSTVIAAINRSQHWASGQKLQTRWVQGMHLPLHSQSTSYVAWSWNAGLHNALAAYVCS